MPARIRHLAAALAATAALSSGTLAQRLPVGATVATASITAYTQLDADIDGGGEVRGSGGFAIGSMTRQVTSAFAAGFSLRYDQEDWRFTGTNDFGGSPWSQIYRPGVDATFVYATDSGYAFLVRPSVQWAYASGANSGDALNWGAVFAVSRAFSPDLTLGIGAGVFREIDENEVFPVVLVDWRINDRLRLANSVQAGPAGGAGIELAWTIDDRWEIAAGGAWRHFRFRLARDGSFPDGIGEKDSIPLLARATWRPSATTRLDFYAGVALAGQLTVYDKDNHEVLSRDVDPAPLFGITLKSTF